MGTFLSISPNNRQSAYGTHISHNGRYPNPGASCNLYSGVNTKLAHTLTESHDYALHVCQAGLAGHFYFQA
jgi:hypothetical protein